MKTLLRIMITTLLLVGVIGFTAISKSEAKGGGEPGDEPDGIVETL